MVAGTPGYAGLAQEGAEVVRQDVAIKFGLHAGSDGVLQPVNHNRT